VNKIDLLGRNAVVTGGAQGIGLAVAKRLAQSGAKISIWDRDRLLMQDIENEFDAGVSIHKVEVELTDPDSVADSARKTAIEMGSIDIFVNNAGIAGPTRPSWEYPIADWQQVIDVDLNGVYYCCRSIMPIMREQDYGRIVNVASIAGKEGNPNAVAYSAAKAGVIALTKSIAKETADKNISVNCITPAAAKTRIFDQISTEHIEYMLSKIPRGRFILVEEIASMVAWLVSEENSFTT
jgi:3-oxoacyl-[acyl-carrier protein] reductase